MDIADRHEAEDSAAFPTAGEFGRAVGAVETDAETDLLIGFHDGGFWWTLTPVHRPGLVPTTALAGLTDAEVERLRKWAAR